MKKWPKISRFSNIVKLANKLNVAEVSYYATPKLDGTNSSIRMNYDGSVQYFSRNREITPDDDNYGFAAWASQYAYEWSDHLYEEDVIVYGEWIGKGIQNKAAVCQIEEREFVVFGAYLCHSEMWLDPEEIMYGDSLEHIWDIPNVLPIPVYEPDRLPSVDFMDLSSVAEFTEAVNDMVSEVENECPYAMQVHEISGVGEGLVFYPYATVQSEYSMDLVFKAKGTAHEVVKAKKSASMSPEVLRKVEEFCTYFCTVNRFDQALELAGIPYYDRPIESIGDFLKVVMKDIKDESVDELEASELQWKVVSKYIAKRAKDWYMEEVI